MVKKLFVKDKSFYRTLFMLLLPVVFQNIITIGVNIVDNIMLGRYGEIQLSGCSLANDYINIFQILCMGMGGGAAVLTAQFYGENDNDKIKKSVAIMLRICLAIVAVFTFLTLFFSGKIMSIYTVDADVIEKGSLYLKLSVPTFFLMGLSQTLTMILRSVKKVYIPLISSIIGFFVNVFFNWVFIFGNLGMPELQIAGAAIGTVIARIVEFLIIVIYFFVIDKTICFRIRDIFTFSKELFHQYVRYSIPVICSDTLLAFGNTAVSIVIGHVSTEFVAANAIIATVVRLSTVFTSGLGNAAATMTGNTVGKREYEKAYQQAVTMITIAFIAGLLSSVIILVLAPAIISMYEITEQTREIAMQMMYAVSIMVVFQALQSSLTKGILRGGGDTRFCMFADAGFLWLVSVPLGSLLGLVIGAPPFFIYIALKSDWAIKSILCLFRVRSKKWIKKI